MSKKKREINILDPNADPVKLILLLVWPMIIEEIMSILVNFVDTAMVGSLGVYATASVALGSPIIGVCNGIAIGLSSGFGVMMSRRIGEGRKDLALKTMQQSVYYIAAMGILLTALFSYVFAENLPAWMNAQADIYQPASDYLRWFGYSRWLVVATLTFNTFLRGQGDTRDPMIGNLIANISNCVLNYLFIFPSRTVTVLGMSIPMWGLGKGVAGAAMATSCANALQCLFITSRIFGNQKLEVPLHLGRLGGIDKELYLFTLSLGWPLALERFLNAMGRTVCTRLLAGISNEVLSAHSLANTAESIIFMTVMGFGTVSTTLVSQWLGARNKDRAKLMAKECLRMSFIVGLISTSIVFIFCPQIIGFFTDSEEVIQMASLALRIQCAIEPIEAVTMSLAGVLRGAGDVKITAYISFLGMWVVRVIGAELLIRVFHWGLLGVWIPMAVDWVIRFAIYYPRYRRGKWLDAWKAPTAKA
ncbi:MAG: MATE family efflux transporter [Firmicutes bacterium]|nr:MATE family efflux transporter [Bacillota bacterium]